jgi:hypothetical protein
VIPALSDYHSFELEQVPFLFLTNGRWVHYHQVTDTPEKLDYDKMLVSADYLSKLVLELSNREEERIPYRADRRDDLGTLSSLFAFASALSAHHAAAERMRAAIEGLLREMEKGVALGVKQRRQISQLVFALEAMLMG